MLKQKLSYCSKWGNLSQDLKDTLKLINCDGDVIFFYLTSRVSFIKMLSHIEMTNILLYDNKALEKHSGNKKPGIRTERRHWILYHDGCYHAQTLLAHYVFDKTRKTSSFTSLKAGSSSFLLLKVNFQSFTK